MRGYRSQPRGKVLSRDVVTQEVLNTVEAVHRLAGLKLSEFPRRHIPRRGVSLLSWA